LEEIVEEMDSYQDLSDWEKGTYRSNYLYLTLLVVQHFTYSARSQARLAFEYRPDEDPPKGLFARFKQTKTQRIFVLLRRLYDTVKEILHLLEINDYYGESRGQIPREEVDQLDSILSEQSWETTLFEGRELNGRDFSEVIQTRVANWRDWKSISYGSLGGPTFDLFGQLIDEEEPQPVDESDLDPEKERQIKLARLADAICYPERQVREAVYDDNAELWEVKMAIAEFFHPEARIEHRQETRLENSFAVKNWEDIERTEAVRVKENENDNKTFTTEVRELPSKNYSGSASCFYAMYFHNENSFRLWSLVIAGSSSANNFQSVQRVSLLVDSYRMEIWDPRVPDRGSLKSRCRWGELRPVSYESGEHGEGLMIHLGYSKLGMQLFKRVAFADNVIVRVGDCMFKLDRSSREPMRKLFYRAIACVHAM